MFPASFGRAVRLYRSASSSLLPRSFQNRLVAPCAVLALVRFVSGGRSAAHMPEPFTIPTRRCCVLFSSKHCHLSISRLGGVFGEGKCSRRVTTVKSKDNFRSRKARNPPASSRRSFLPITCIFRSSSL